MPADLVEGDTEQDVLDLDLAPRRYPALQTISGAFRLLGWLTIILGATLAVVAAIAVGSGEDGNGTVSVVVLVGGVGAAVVNGIILIALADLILVFIDIERNTRASAMKEDDADTLADGS